jgi:starch-binding outer membrane protein, SusD/RagB family
MTMKNIYILFAAILIGLTGCEDYLDRKNLDEFDEANFWTSEGNVRLYATGAYPIYFKGYGQSTDYGPYFTFGQWADEWLSANAWTVITATADNGWHFVQVRRHNIMLDNVARMDNLTDEARAHWTGIGRFLRAMEYTDLVRQFGDVPWFDKPLVGKEAESYKDREPMTVVAMHILEDYEFAAANVRLVDGTASAGRNDAGQINRDVVFGYMSRHLLYLGTYIKYHNLDMAVANQLLEKSKWAAEQLINGGKYIISNDYRALFASADLGTNKEVIFFRQYETAKLVHSIASYNNSEPQTGATLKLINTYLTADGLPIKQSPDYNYAADNNARPYNTADAADLDIYTHRDPRMVATFNDELRINGVHAKYATSGFSTWKFLPYEATDGGIYAGNNNTTDAPVMRFGEVLINYAEAAAELGQFDQAAADKSINKLRARVITDRKGIAQPALARMVVNGGQVYADGYIDPLNDPDRDPTVSPLLWEIRRERAVELVFEGHRKNDLKRWNKYEYLRTEQEGDTPKPTTLGAFIDLTDYTAAQQTKIKAAQEIFYTNAAKTEGFLHILKKPEQLRKWENGNIIYERQYLNAVPKDQITLYKGAGFTLTQNPGWESPE